MEHQIKTNIPPIKQSNYPLSPARQQVMNTEIDKMLELVLLKKGVLNEVHRL